MTLEEVRKQFPEAETFTFGDTQDLSELLLKLVREGKKTATCGALRDYYEGEIQDGKEAFPVIGRRDIALNWSGEPALVIETTEVTVRRFCEVDVEFALAEGEDDSLEGWRNGHRAFFERNGGWSPEMKLVCERFKLIRDFGLPT